MRIKRGYVVFGIGEDFYDANWVRDLQTIKFVLNEPFPYGPYKSQKIIVKRFEGYWDNFLPYQLGGEIVDETVDAIAKPGEVWGTQRRPRRSKCAS